MTDQSDLEAALSPASFQQKFGICNTTFYAEIKAGRLRAKKLGRRTLVDAAEARRWFASLRDMGAPA